MQLTFRYQYFMLLVLFLYFPKNNYRYNFSVLRIRDIYPGSKFFPSRIPDPDPQHCRFLYCWFLNARYRIGT
jgi:hypothetical protein